MNIFLSLESGRGLNNENLVLTPCIFAIFLSIGTNYL